MTGAAMSRGTQATHSWRPTHGGRPTCAKHLAEKAPTAKRTTPATFVTSTMTATAAATLLAMLLLITGCRQANCGRSVVLTARTSSRHLRGRLGTDHYQQVVNESQALAEMCDGRQRNESPAAPSSSWGQRHDEEWYTQCRKHWKQADTLDPNNQWTRREFADFVQLQSHAEFKRLPLPLTMIFNELSCRCVMTESTDCCLGTNAKIAPDDTADHVSWMDSICVRVDKAIDEVCRRQHYKSTGGEL